MFDEDRALEDYIADQQEAEHRRLEQACEASKADGTHGKFCDACFRPDVLEKDLPF